MHPLKIVILLVLFYLLYRLYMAGRKKGMLQSGKEKQASLEDVLVQDPVCGAYVPRSQALQRSRDGKEFFFCSEKCSREFDEQKRS